MMIKTYNIAYATDDTFAPILGVSIFSLLYNNKDAQQINVFIMDSGISNDNRIKLEEIFDNFNNASLKWIKMKSISEKMGIDVKNDRGSFSQYSRFFVGDILDSTINRVLYLDCDTLIVSSIVNLWNINLEQNIVAAMDDAFSKYYRKNINLNDSARMFNSGVMLIDLQKWRKYNVKNKLFRFIEKNKGKVQQGDQGALNSVLSEKTFSLDPCYNLVSIFYDLTYKEIQLYRGPVGFFSESEIENAKEKPVIIHFTSSFYSIRPWYKNSNHKLKNLWLQYYMQTPWRNTPLLIENNKSRKLANKLFKTKLRKPFLLSAGIFQKYIRPFKNRFM